MVYPILQLLRETKTIYHHPHYGQQFQLEVGLEKSIKLSTQIPWFQLLRSLEVMFL